MYFTKKREKVTTIIKRTKTSLTYYINKKPTNKTEFRSKKHYLQTSLIKIWIENCCSRTIQFKSFIINLKFTKQSNLNNYRVSSITYDLARRYTKKFKIYLTFNPKNLLKFLEKMRSVPRQNGKILASLNM